MPERSARRAVPRRGRARGERARSRYGLLLLPGLELSFHAVFAWVAERRLPAVANGDFHRSEHLATWKTLLPCRKDARSIVRHLRSSRPALIAPFAPAAARAAA